MAGSKEAEQRYILSPGLFGPSAGCSDVCFSFHGSELFISVHAIANIVRMYSLDRGTRVSIAKGCLHLDSLW
jgi:hypothetical protein